MRDRKENYRRTEDGTLLVRKPAQGWQMGLSGDTERDLWYECSEKSADKRFLLMVAGGWFGLHKFMEGKVLQGFFYLLTCGCFGVFYISDLIAMLGGGYCFKRVVYEDEGKRLERKMHKIYYGPLENKKRAAGLFLLSFVLLVISVQFIYQLVGQALLAWLAAAGSDRVTQEGLEQFIGFVR